MKLTKEFVDTVKPEHDRISCDDNNLNNGLGSAGHWGRTGPRCTRCGLLEIVEIHNGIIPDNFKLQVELRITEYDSTCPCNEG